MFALDSTIDTIQTGKKMFVSTFVTNEAIAKAMNEFVDAQTEYTKKAVKAGTNAVTTFGEETTKAFNSISKFDWNKFYTKKM